MRNFLLVLLIGLGGVLSAQDCITVTPVDTIFDTENFESYNLVVDVTYNGGGTSPGWILASDISTLNTSMGPYGRVTLGPITCSNGTSYIYGFADQLDIAGCISQNQQAFIPEFCGQGNCNQVTLAGFTDETCRPVGPNFRILGGAPPLDITITAPGGSRQTRRIDFLSRVVDLTDLTTPGDYTVMLTTGDGCTAEENFNITPCNASISGYSWIDENENGIREAVEQPVPAEVLLLELSTGSQRFFNTEGDGQYEFTELPAGDYEVRFVVSDCDLQPTLRNQGNDESIDSDIDTTGSTVVSLALGQAVTNLADAGWRFATCSVDVDVEQPVCGAGRGTITITSDCSGPTYQLRNDRGRVIDPVGFGEYQDVPAGTFTLTTIYGNGCTIDTTFILTGFNDADLQIATAGTLCSLAPLVTLTAPSQVGDEPVAAYLWSTGATTQSITVTTNDTYEVTLLLTNGCEIDLAVNNIGERATIPLEPVYFTDCVTGEVTIQLPEEFRGGDPFWMGTFNNLPPDADSITVTEDVDFLTVEVFFGECAAFGETRVRQGSFTGLAITTPDANCAEAQLLEVTRNGEQEFFEFNNDLTIAYDWSGPGSFEEDDIFPNQIFIDGTPGIYQATLTSYCGDTTLNFLVAENPEDCGDETPPLEFFGELSLDTDADCGLNPADQGIPNALIEFAPQNGGISYFVRTNRLGRFTGIVPATTDYDIILVNAEGRNLELCAIGSLTNEIIANQAVQLRAQSTADCSSLDVAVASPRFRRCFENTAGITFSNPSAVSSNNTLVTVVVDSLFEDLTATLPFTRVGNELLFDLNTLPPFTEGRIGLTFKVSCESEFGQLHCLDASISSDNRCDPTEGIALVTVEALDCTGDSTSFRIQNIGSEAMASDLEYYVYEDGVQRADLSLRRPALQAGQQLTVELPAMGATVMLVAKQEIDAENTRYPSATVTGCGGDIPGFATIGAEQGISGEYELCRTNTGSFDPNEKLVFPRGVNGMNNDIEPGTRLTYELHFQNTGTDTAFTVVIRDTLPEALDLGSIEFGAASHDYFVDIENERELVFVFNQINLVDSFTNVMGSMGVVSFTINHNSELQRGDSFRNRAGIFFDFNEPIITEYANTRIAPLPPMVVSARETEQLDLPIMLSPNPVRDLLRIELPAEVAGAGLSIDIVNGFGRVLRTVSGVSTVSSVDVAELPSGVYTLGVRNASQLLGRARFLVVK